MAILAAGSVNVLTWGKLVRCLSGVAWRECFCHPDRVVWAAVIARRSATIRASFRSLLAGTAVAIVASACSPGTGAQPARGAELDSTFSGFRLLAPQARVLADAQRMGMTFECRSDETFESFCSQGLDPAAGKPDLSFGFRGGRLVGLVRSTRTENAAPPPGDMAAQFRRALGAPVVEGWMNRSIHARMWANADTSVIGVLTCTNPSDMATCDAGLDHTVGTNIPQLLDDWRGMIERNAATASPQSPPRP